MTLFRRLSLKPPNLRLHRAVATESTQPQLAIAPSSALGPVNQDHLLRVCTILYQQQNSPDSRLNSKLSSAGFNLTHEFFLQICNSFPLSWRPVYRFFLYTQTRDPNFPHSSVTFNKMLDIIGKSRNMDLLWEVAKETGKRKLINDKTFRIVLKSLASARELKKSVDFFHLMNDFGYTYNLQTLNRVVETLCKNKLVEEAKFVVTKLKDWIKPDETTYRLIIEEFCDVGDLIQASKVWNLMMDEGFEMDIESGEKIMATIFKKNLDEEAIKLFWVMKTKKPNDLGVSTYRIVIDRLCKRGKIDDAHKLFDEMRQRKISADNQSYASIIYGLLAKRRISEAYKVAEQIENPDIEIYHGLIKGLLKLKRASEATKVFREMIKRGCEPIMHTYVMLLQGHLGRRGRKGPDPLVNFDTIFVGGLIKAGKRLEATKYVERTMNRGLEVPRFDYNKFLSYYSNEEGVLMFEDVGKKLREVGLFDLADILQRYGEKMATRDRRRDRTIAS